MLEINTAKEVVQDAISKQKEKLVNELEDISCKIENHTSFAEIVGELVAIYGNNNRQREVLVDVMRTLPGNFFRNFDVSGKMNSANLTFDGITFSISTSRIKSIEISLDEIEKPEEGINEAYKTYTPYETGFLKFWENKDLDKLNPKEEKDLIKTYFNVKHGRDTPFLYTRKLRNNNYDEIKVYLEDIRKRMNIYQREKKNVEMEQDKYKLELDKYYELLSEMEINFRDFLKENYYIMKDFTKNSWNIKFVNVPKEWFDERIEF